jgi:hypothetical protein
MVPKTLEECYAYLRNLEDIEKWLAKSEDVALSEAHHGIGQWIRNNWGLWKAEGELYNWFKENEINHPDDMSGIILVSFHRYMKKKDIKLEEQFDDSINYYLDDRQKLLSNRRKKLLKMNARPDNT